MSEQTRVLLVDGCDRQTLPLAKIYKSMNCHVTTLNASKLDNGYASRYPDNKIVSPQIKDNKAAHIAEIKRLLSTGNYDVAVTTSDDTAEGLALIKEEFKGKVRIAMVDPELFYLAYDKNNTMRICMDNAIPCPKTYFDKSSVEELLKESLTYPMVVKPCKSFGAIGYHRVDNETELIEICKDIEGGLQNYVIQEYIPQTDIQYECAMFVDDNNVVKTACVFSKNRWFPVNGGSSTCNVTVDRPDIIESCTRLLQTINWRGAADIDLIQDPRDGVAKIMEINPRVSGSVKVVLKSGVNIAEQIVQLAMGREVTPYLDYKKDVRMRCIHTDLLWFIKSPNRFHSSPSWFSWKNTSDQIFDIKDPWPFLTFSIEAVLKYKKEMKKRS